MSLLAGNQGKEKAREGLGRDEGRLPEEGHIGVSRSQRDRSIDRSFSLGHSAANAKLKTHQNSDHPAHLFLIRNNDDL
jgi:hypothetical protein